MLITRKELLRAGGAFALASAAGIGGAQAQEYPSQDIHLICGFPPGSGADIFVRFFGEKLRPISGRNIIVENKPGANSNIATEYVARGKPDGYLLYPFAGTTVAATMALFKNPPVDVGKTIRVAATTSNLAFMLMVDVNSPYKTVADLTAAMKKKGAAASYAVAANPGIIMGAIYKGATGIEAVEVLYKNAIDSLNELRAASSTSPSTIRSSGWRSSARAACAFWRSRPASDSSPMPDIPTMAESGVPMDLNLWWGVMVAAATPKPIVDKINAWFKEIVNQEDTKKFLALSGADPMIRTPEEAQAMFHKAIPEWAEYVRIGKIPQT